MKRKRKTWQVRYKEHLAAIDRVLRIKLKRLGVDPTIAAKNHDLRRLVYPNGYSEYWYKDILLIEAEFGGYSSTG